LRACSPKKVLYCQAGRNKHSDCEGADSGAPTPPSRILLLSPWTEHSPALVYALIWSWISVPLSVVLQCCPALNDEGRSLSSAFQNIRCKAPLRPHPPRPALQLCECFLRLQWGRAEPRDCSDENMLCTWLHFFRYEVMGAPAPVMLTRAEMQTFITFGPDRRRSEK